MSWRWASSRGWKGTFWRVRISAVGPSCAGDRRRPRHRGLHRVAGPPDVEVRDQAQARGVLDRLMGGPVLAQADRVVGEHEDRAQLHQRRHAQRVARVIGEGQKGADVGDEPAVQGQAVGDRAHAELAHPEVEVVARRGLADRDAARPVGEHRAGQVGGAAEQFGQRGGQRLERLLRRLAGGHAGRLGRLRRDERGGASSGQCAGSSPAIRRLNSAASCGYAAR